MEFPEKDDPQKLLYLYSESNIEDDAVLSFWKTALHSYFLQHPQSFTFRVQDIIDAYTVGMLYPTSFLHVLPKLQAEGVLLNYDQFLKSTNPTVSSSSSNGTNETQESSLISAFISTVWTIGEKWLTSSEANPSAGSKDQVMLYATPLEKLSQHVPAYVKPKDENELIYTLRDIPNFSYLFSSFLKEINQQLASSESNLMYTLQQTFNQHENIVTFAKYLVKKELAHVHDDIVQVVKPIDIKSPSKQTVTGPTSTFYISLMQVRLSIHQIEKKIVEFETKSNDHKQKAIRAKASGNTEAALSQLKLKRSTEEQIKRLVGAQHTLEESLMNMEGSMMNVHIINAYKVASGGLKASRQETGLSVESVEDAIDQFQEEMDELKEINEAIVSGSSLSAGEEMELNEELDALLKEMEAEKMTTKAPVTPIAKPSVAQPSLQLPTAPTSIPIMSTNVNKQTDQNAADRILEMEARLASL